MITKKYFLIYLVMLVLISIVFVTYYSSLIEKIERRVEVSQEIGNLKLSMLELHNHVSLIQDSGMTRLSKEVVNQYLTDHNRFNQLTNSKSIDLDLTNSRLKEFDLTLNKYKEAYFKVPFSDSVSLILEQKMKSKKLNELYTHLSNIYFEILNEINEYELGVNRSLVADLSFFRIILGTLFFIILIFCGVFFLILIRYSDRYFLKLSSREKILDKVKSETSSIQKTLESFRLGEYSTSLDSLRSNPSYDDLVHLQMKLDGNDAEVKDRDWTTQGLNQLSEILRRRGDSLSELYDEVISFIVRYTGSNQGGIFILTDENSANSNCLELVSCYAYERKKSMERYIPVGNGLVGQCFEEATTTYLKSVPADYLNITSGLGYATARNLALVPLKIDQRAVGVIELASFKEFKESEIQFIEKACESVAITVERSVNAERTKSLLTKSQVETQILRVHEEELKYSLEDLESFNQHVQKERDHYKSAVEMMNSRLTIFQENIPYFEIDLQGRFTYITKCFVNLLNGSDLLKEGVDHQIVLGINIIEHYLKGVGIRKGKIHHGVLTLSGRVGSNTKIRFSIVPIFSTPGETASYGFWGLPVWDDGRESKNELFVEDERMIAVTIS